MNSTIRSVHRLRIAVFELDITRKQFPRWAIYIESRMRVGGCIVRSVRGVEALGSLNSGVCGRWTDTCENITFSYLSDANDDENKLVLC